VVEVEDPIKSKSDDSRNNKNSITPDNSSNIFSISDYLGNDGVARGLFNISLKKERKDDIQNAPYEMGHTMGMDHFSNTIMNDGNSGNTNITSDNLDDTFNLARKTPSIQRKANIFGNLPIGGRIRNKE
jgi:hypothetical protein